MKVQVPGFEPGSLAFVPLHFLFLILLKRLEGQNPNQLDYTCLLREESEPSLNTFPHSARLLEFFLGEVSEDQGARARQQAEHRSVDQMHHRRYSARAMHASQCVLNTARNPSTVVSKVKNPTNRLEPSTSR